VAKVAEVERESAVVLETHDLLHLVDEARLAVGREPHHLVFVAIVREADELRHRLVEHAERMREVDAALDRELAALAQTPGGRREVAEAVDRHRHGLVVGRHQERRGEMTEMMLDGMDCAGELLVRQRALQVAGDIGAVLAMTQPLQDITGAHARGQDVGELAPAVGRIVAVDRDVVHIGERDAGFLEAIADRLAGEAAPVLDPPEALLFDCGDEIAVLHQASGGVGMIGVEAEDIGHLAESRPRSRRSRCMERIMSAVIRCAV
jgi:hypothetical protein